MIQAKCIEKFRDKNNHIYGYRLIDLNGQTQDIQSDNLKRAIQNGQINVVNLTLTSDNRLVDKTEKQPNDKIAYENYTDLCKKIADYIIKELGAGIKDTGVSNDSFAEIQYYTIEKFAMYIDVDEDDEDKYVKLENNMMIHIYNNEPETLCILIEVGKDFIVISMNGADGYLEDYIELSKADKYIESFEELDNSDLNKIIIIDETNSYIMKHNQKSGIVYKSNKTGSESYNKEDIQFLMKYCSDYIKKHFELDSTNGIIYYYSNENEKKKANNAINSKKQLEQLVSDIKKDATIDKNLNLFRNCKCTANTEWSKLELDEDNHDKEDWSYQTVDFNYIFGDAFDRWIKVSNPQLYASEAVCNHEDCIIVQVVYKDKEILHIEYDCNSYAIVQSYESLSNIIAHIDNRTLLNYMYDNDIRLIYISKYNNKWNEGTEKLHKNTTEDKVCICDITYYEDGILKRGADDEITIKDMTLKDIVKFVMK